MSQFCYRVDVVKRVQEIQTVSTRRILSRFFYFNKTPKSLSFDNNLRPVPFAFIEKRIFGERKQIILDVTLISPQNVVI